MSVYLERAEHAWTEDSVRLIVTQSAFAKSSLYYVQEAGHFRTFEPYFTERMQLDSFLVVFTVTGKGRLTYQDKTYTLDPHQLFFIDCMEYQYYATEPGERWELLWVHLNGSSTRGYYEQFAQRGNPIMMLKSESNIPGLLQQLIRIHRHKSIRTELISSKLLVELLTELVLIAQGTETTAEMPSLIGSVMNMLDQSYPDKITLDQLATSHAVSKYHLAKEFKRYTGFSPGEYLINTRITRAKELIKYTDHSVAEIAGKVGIDNVSHFILLFKARTGLTPLVFRKKWQRPH